MIVHLEHRVSLESAQLKLWIFLVEVLANDNYCFLASSNRQISELANKTDFRVFVEHSDFPTSIASRLGGRAMLKRQ